MARVNDAKRNKRVSFRAAYVSAWFVAVLVALVLFFCSVAHGSLAGDSVQCSTINTKPINIVWYWHLCGDMACAPVCVCAMPTKVHCNLQLCILPGCTAVHLCRHIASWMAIVRPAPNVERFMVWPRDMLHFSQKEKKKIKMFQECEWVCGVPLCLMRPTTDRQRLKLKIYSFYMETVALAHISTQTNHTFTALQASIMQH